VADGKTARERVQTTHSPCGVTFPYLFPEERDDSRLLFEELGERAIELDGRVQFVDLGTPQPGKMDHRKPVRLVAMTEQDVVDPTSHGERDDRHTVEEMPRGQLSLKLGLEVLRLVSVRPIPAVGQLMPLRWIG
jgi:hypothetical protein